MGPAQDEPPPPEQKSGPELRGALWALDSVEVLCEPIEIIFYSQINLNIVHHRQSPCLNPLGLQTTGTPEGLSGVRVSHGWRGGF